MRDNYFKEVYVSQITGIIFKGNVHSPIQIYKVIAGTVIFYFFPVLFYLDLRRLSKIILFPLTTPTLAGKTKPIFWEKNTGKKQTKTDHSFDLSFTLNNKNKSILKQ